MLLKLRNTEEERLVGDGERERERERGKSMKTLQRTRKTTVKTKFETDLIFKKITY